MKRTTLVIIFFLLLVVGKAQSPNNIIVSPYSFTTSTTISYTITYTDTITIQVYDVVGRTINTFINDSLVNAGSYSFNYNTSSLAAGMYYFILKANGYTSVARRGLKVAATGINQVSKSINSNLIYPNPSNKTININYEGLKKIEIVDLFGRTVKTVSTSDKIISVEEIRTGEYFINVYVENKLIITDKLLKLE